MYHLPPKYFVNVPSFVLIPFKNAVAELAESVPCKLTAYVFARAVHGNSSQLNTVSSPCLPFDWPTRKRVAVMVEMPIPSPRNKMALLAVLVFGLILRLSSMSLTPSLYHGFSSWFRKRSSVTPRERKNHLLTKHSGLKKATGKRSNMISGMEDCVLPLPSPSHFGSL